MNNPVDYIEEIEPSNSMSLAERELKSSANAFLFSSSMTVVTKEGNSTKIDLNELDKFGTFFQNLKYWKRDTEFMSTNNMDNAHFQQIVDMGIDAVPYIVEELKKGPTQLVHALDLIFPNVIKYEGFVSLKDACDKWLSILS